MMTQLQKDRIPDTGYRNSKEFGPTVSGIPSHGPRPHGPTVSGPTVSGPRSRRLPGFTLVEMLVVITIIAILAAMMLPAIGGITMLVNKNKSQSIINTLDAAVKLYQQDFSAGNSSDPNALPPSNSISAGGTTSTVYGCQSIVYYLTGYHDDPNNSNRIAYGLKPNRNSPTYGPYLETDKLRVSSAQGGTNDKLGAVNDNDVYAIKDAGGTARPTFLDAFGKPILYYKGSGGSYSADNTCADSHHGKWGGGVYYSVMYRTASNGYTYADIWEPQFGPVPDSSTFSYIRSGEANVGTGTSASSLLYRSDFMLLSWGGDAKWYAPGYLMRNPGYSGSNPPLSNIRDDANNLNTGK